MKGQGTEADAATLEQLTQYYAAAQYVRGAYVGPNGNDGAKAAFDGASALLDNLAADASSDGALATSAQALRAMADALESSLGAGALDQLPALVEGLSGLSSEYGRFHDGLAEYASGLSSLSSKYQDFASGASQFAGGAGDLAGGANDLSDGMSALDESTATLPETMREKIGEMTAEFDFPEFEPVSFVSSENANVTAVQFVMATSPIEKPEAPQEEEARHVGADLVGPPAGPVPRVGSAGEKPWVGRAAGQAEILLRGCADPRITRCRLRVCREPADRPRPPGPSCV